MCGISPCGDPTCTWSEAHRFKCEAAHALKMGRAWQMAYYAGAAKTRGDEYVKRLRAEVRRQFTDGK